MALCFTGMTEEMIENSLSIEEWMDNLSIYLFIRLSIYRLIHPSTIYQSIYPTIYLFIYSRNHLFISIYLFI